MKNLLIISPYFPPVNAPDMQRVRMSLPYFSEMGWEAEVVTVNAQDIDINKDELLLQSVPGYIKIHQVKALDKKWTAKVGLGSIALRSLWFFKQKVNALLSAKHYDLIYFSTTQFPVCVLGPYWKFLFKVPYVIDMQDPWHSDYYQDKPKKLQPAKYWFSYRLHKYLEPIAIKRADGLISVSGSYITTLQERYPVIKGIPTMTLTFGAFQPDFEIAKKNEHLFKKLLDDQSVNIVYVGRGGVDMHRSIQPVFEAFKQYLAHSPLGKKIKFYFIGTSYASKGRTRQTILPLAEKCGVEDWVVEIADRISFYHTLCVLSKADALFIPGSDDPGYTASKIYPYLLSDKPVFGVFNPHSPAISVLKEFGVTSVYDYENINQKNVTDFFDLVINSGGAERFYAKRVAGKYSAEEMTRKQVFLFNQVLAGGK